MYYAFNLYSQNLKHNAVFVICKPHIQSVSNPMVHTRNYNSVLSVANELKTYVRSIGTRNIGCNQQIIYVFSLIKHFKTYM